ncbi:MAG: CHRD domain-containing protein [Phycisphaerales bacterium]|nr:CHRD domain-containing protein [Phycisphaerales bacterium]
MKTFIAASWIVVSAIGSAAQAHIYNFYFGMSGANVVPPTDSLARGSGAFRYNHHTFNYDLDLYVSGVALTDLLDTGPNGTPLQAFVAPRGQNGDIALDPGYFGDFVQDGDGIRLTLSTIRLGGQQGAFSSNIYNTEQALYDGHLYFQLFTTQYPNGEIRGQIPPLGRFLQTDDLGSSHEVKGLSRIPAPGTCAVGLLALVGWRRRR